MSSEVAVIKTAWLPSQEGQDGPLPPPQWEPGVEYTFRRPLTAEEYYELIDEDSNTELVEGVIVVESPVSDDHEALFDFLHKVLSGYVEAEGLGQVRGSRTGVRIDDYNVPEPDLLFVRADRLNVIHRLDVRDGPDLVLEIISPTDRPGALVRKQTRYERRGTRELWWIDQPRRKVRILHLDETGHFVEWTPEEQGLLRSATVEGFWVREEWLWHRVGEFPSSATVLCEIRGLDRVLAELGPEAVVKELGPEAVVKELGPEAVVKELGPEAVVEHLSDEETLAALRRKLGPEAFAQLLRRWMEGTNPA
jgi:Uma2 family endonuclease